MLLEKGFDDRWRLVGRSGVGNAIICKGDVLEDVGECLGNDVRLIADNHDEANRHVDDVF